MIVNIHEAKTHLSQLLIRVALGETVIIAKDGHPIAQLVGIATQLAQRQPGLGKGTVWMADDWDADETNQQVAALFGLTVREELPPYATRKPVKGVKSARAKGTPRP